MRRRTKAEIAQKKVEEKEEKNAIEECRTIKGFLNSRRYKIEDLPQIIEKDEQLVSYLKEKGVMTSEGQMKI